MQLLLGDCINVVFVFVDVDYTEQARLNKKPLINYQVSELGAGLVEGPIDPEYFRDPHFNKFSEPLEIKNRRAFYSARGKNSLAVNTYLFDAKYEALELLDSLLSLDRLVSS